MNARLKFLAILMAFAVVLSAGANDTFRMLKVSGMTYTNVTVTTVTATDIYFTYDGGMGNAKLENLSPELQEHFHYNATAAAAQERQQAMGNAQYLAAQALQWGTDLSDALVQAVSKNRCILVEFTSADKLGLCMQLDQDVLSTAQFAGFAQNNLVLVRIVSRHDLTSRDDRYLRRVSEDLAHQFNVTTRPTCILLDPYGKELGRQVGLLEGGPAAFIAWLKSFSPTAAATTQAAPLSVSRVASFVADVVPKFGRKWYLIAGVLSGLVLLALMLRSVSKR